MANISKPSKLNLLWASGGDILDPGDTKYQTGWAVEVPPRQWENYIQNKQDQAIAHINQHGIAVWDAETEYQANTSYAQGQTNGTIYRAKLTHSGQNPELDTLNTYWDIAFAAAGDFYTKAEVDADFLAKDENLADLPNAGTARTNLSVYSKAETYTKTEVDGKTTIATQLQAEEAVANSVLMTPYRTRQYAEAKILGTAQTWQDFTASRAFSTTYTNSTNKTICVSISSREASGTGVLDLRLFIDNVLISRFTMPAGVSVATVFGMVPPGSTYRVERQDTNDILETWREFR